MESGHRTVRLGEFNSLTSIDCNGSHCLPPSEDFEIDVAFRHGGYSRTNRIHDIGLLRLAKSVEYKGSRYIDGTHV